MADDGIHVVPSGGVRNSRIIITIYIIINITVSLYCCCLLATGKRYRKNPSTVLQRKQSSFSEHVLSLVRSRNF